MIAADMATIADRFVQGESVTFSAADAGYSTVRVGYGAKSAAMTLAEGVWSATVSTAGLSGRFNWAIFADGCVVDSGSFVVVVLASAYRAAVAAIDAAMQKVAANGKYSMSVGEISLTDKTFDEMMKWRAYYESLAEAQEGGTSSVLSPYRTEVALT